MSQDVLPVDLVVKDIEAVSWFVLRLAIQLDLEFSNLTGCCQTHRQSPSPSLFHKHTNKQGSFAPPALPGLNAPMTLSDAQAGRRPFRRRAETRAPPVLSLPQLPGSPFLHAVLTTPVDRLRCICRLLSSLRRSAFPVMQAGRHPRLTFEACSSFTRVTACKIAHPPYVGFIARLRPTSVSRIRTLASCQVLPTTTWVGPSPTGDPRRWGTLHKILCASQHRNGFARTGENPPGRGTMARSHAIATFSWKMEQRSRSITYRPCRIKSRSCFVI
jgi:hypothetical protein